MKRPKLFLTAMTVCLIWSVALADSSSNGSASGSPNPPGGYKVARVVLTHYKGTTKRPNAPSRHTLECTYGEGFIEPIFPEGVNFITIRLYDEFNEWTAMVTPNCSVAEFPILTGTYNLECTFDNGYVFVGTIEF